MDIDNNINKFIVSVLSTIEIELLFIFIRETDRYSIFFIKALTHMLYGYFLYL